MSEIQANQLNIEVICIDDASKLEFRVLHAKHCKSIDNTIRYIQLEENIGRAAIRNQFLHHISSENCLFLDCDGEIESPNFLNNYINSIQQFPNSVICGGRQYPNAFLGRKHALRWKYGHKIESKPACVREQNPYASFLTNNVLIPKVILSKIPFLDTIREYGHEDTVFGFQLFKHKLPICHIENPVINSDVETNTEFIIKTEAGLRSLNFVTAYLNDVEFENSIQLLKVYSKLQTQFIGRIGLKLGKLFQPILRITLRSGFAPLLLFSTYKLLYYASIDKKAY